MGFIEKIFGWIKKFFSIVDLAQQWLDEVETQYPGLVGIAIAIYNSLQDKIKKAQDVVNASPTPGNEDALDAIKANAREKAIDLMKDATSGSPRAVPEPILRAVFEMVVLTKGDYSWYDQKHVREHAVEILSRRG